MDENFAVAVDGLWKILAVFDSQLAKYQHWPKPLICPKPPNLFKSPSTVKKNSTVLRDALHGACIFEGGSLLLNLTPVTNTLGTLQTWVATS